MIISQTPLRISFVGGGTDLPSFYRQQPGMVLSSSIDKYIFVIVTERFDEKIYINYTKKEIVDRVDQIQHALVREAMIKTGIEKGIEITMLADIPSAGSGLGSSSSLTVGLLNVLYNLKGQSVTAEQLAREACEIEIYILNNPIGKQDQYIAAFGGLKKIIFNPDDSVEVVSLNASADKRIKLGSNLLLHFTNITRNANLVLAEQNSKAQENFTFLCELANLVPLLEESYKAGDIDAFGEFLRINWELKKKLASGISKPEIEEMIKIAENSGATGYKIAGAGGGGFLLSYVPRVLQDTFRLGMQQYQELPFMLDPFGTRIIFNMRRYNSKVSF